MNIPLIEIQPDALQVLHDYQHYNGDSPWTEKIWLRKNNHSYSLSVNNNSFYDNDNNIKITLRNGNIFQYDDGNYKLDIIFPKIYPVFNNLQSIESNLTSLTKIDDNLIIGNSNGSLIKFSYPIGKSLINYELRKFAHFNDILKIMTFPSNKVIVTIGLDMQIKIWSISDNNKEIINEKPLRILNKVHQSRINDIIMIGKGRNLISCSNDGLINIWEIGSGESIWKGKRIKNLNDSCKCLAILEVENGNSNGNDNDNGKFFECYGKILFCGHSSGTITIWDLSNRLSYGEFITNNDNIGIEWINVKDLNNIIIGLINGEIISYKYDLKIKENIRNWHIKININDNSIKNFKSKLINDNKLIILINQYFMELELINGKLNKLFVGIDEDINDFIHINETNELLITGKHQSMALYQ